MKPTRLSTLVVVAVVFGVATWLVLRVTYQRLPPLPWTAAPALLFGAFAEAFTGRGVRARIAGRPGTNGAKGAKGAKPPDPLLVSRLVALAKASSLVATAVAGISAGFDVYLSGSLNVSGPRQDALAAVVTLTAALVFACAALYLEYCCRVPGLPDRDERDQDPLGSRRDDPGSWH